MVILVSGTSRYGLSLIVLVSGGFIGYPQGCRQFDTSCTPLPGLCAPEGGPLELLQHRCDAAGRSVI